VISFAGDGLLAVWPATGEDQDLALATCRAGRCALAVQAALHGYQTLDGLKLSLRIGVGAGEVIGLHVGGVGGRWQLLLSGAPLVQGGLAEQQAARGEVVLSSEAWELAQNACTGQRLPKGGVRLRTAARPRQSCDSSHSCDDPTSWGWRHAAALASAFARWRSGGWLRRRHCGGR
jgi:class 3 adenylate cyclase